MTSQPPKSPWAAFLAPGCWRHWDLARVVSERSAGWGLRPRHFLAVLPRADGTFVYGHSSAAASQLAMGGAPIGLFADGPQCRGIPCSAFLSTHSFRLEKSRRWRLLAALVAAWWCWLNKLVDASPGRGIASLIGLGWRCWGGGTRRQRLKAALIPAWTRISTGLGLVIRTPSWARRSKSVQGQPNRHQSNDAAGFGHAALGPPDPRNMRRDASRCAISAPHSSVASANRPRSNQAGAKSPTAPKH